MTCYIEGNSPRQRVSAAALCRLRLPDGRYILQYNPARRLVKPIGGAFKYTDLSVWSDIGFVPEDHAAPEDQDDLRGVIPADRLSEFYELCRSGRGREHDPRRELEEELLFPLGIPASVGLPRRFVRSGTADIRVPSNIAGDGLIPTGYYFEIYDVTVPDRLVAPIIEYARRGRGIALVTEEEIKQGVARNISYGYEGQTIEGVMVAPTSRLVLSEEVVALPHLKHGVRITANEDIGISYGWGDRVRFKILDDYFKSLGYDMDTPDPHLNDFKRNTPSAVVFLDYTVTVMSENLSRILVDGATLAMEEGKIHELAGPAGSGVSTILRAFADVIDHPRGSALLALPETDVNLHGEPDNHRISYFDCCGAMGTSPDLSKFKPDELRQLMVDSGLFLPDEIEDFLSGKALISPFRTKLAVFAASQDQANIILLDKPFHDRLSPEDIQRISDFLSGQIKPGKIIMIGMDDKYTSHLDYLNEKRILGRRFTIKDRTISPRG